MESSDNTVFLRRAFSNERILRRSRYLKNNRFTEYYRITGQGESSMIIQIYPAQTVNLKPQLHIHGFCPGRATVHPDLASR